MSETVFRFHKHGNYTTIDNRTIRDPELSLKGLGLLTKMISLPPDWSFSFNGLVAICKEGKAAVNTALDDLKKAGYVKITQPRDKNGHYTKVIYDIEEVPDRLLYQDKVPQPENRVAVNPISENQQLLNSNNNKIEKIEKEYKLNNLLLNNYIKELIKTKYVDEDEYNLIYYDKLFKEAEEVGYSYYDIMTSIHWVVDFIKEKNYKDEDGNDIQNTTGTITLDLKEDGTYKLTKSGMEQYFTGHYTIIENALLLKEGPSTCGPGADCSEKYSSFLSMAGDCSKIAGGYGSVFFDSNFTLTKNN